MLLLAASALAAPLAPVSLDRAGLGVSAFVGSRTAWVAETGCDGEACDAWRTDALTGGEVVLALARPIALYGHAAFVQETIDAALYAGDGYALGGGVQATAQLGRLAGLHGWVGVEHQLTGDETLTERASVWQLDAGAFLRVGAPSEGLQAWVGVSATPWSAQRAEVLGGELAVALRPALPVEGVLGAQFLSDPLGGPWDDRTRLGAGISASAGYNAGVTGFLTLQH